MNSRTELGISCGLIIFCLINYLFIIPIEVKAEGSSTTYPFLINTMLLIFALAYGVESVLKLRKEAPVARQKKEKGFVEQYGRTVLLILLTGLWVVAMESAGFILSTVIFLMIAARIFGTRSWGKTLALSLIMPFLFYGVFRGLNSLLPEGPVESLLSGLLG
ncbi:MAG: tripartite tricarboxylate transporter TctB family protein [Desulfarculaceae bacterium]|jgi:hypothetical protein